MTPAHRILERWTRYRRRFGGKPAPTHRPLLDDAELQRLALVTQQLPESLFSFQQHSSHALTGEHASIYRGRGFEFEEHRPYQPGDEPRLLNWRLYARSGALYTKVFMEERRPQVYLVVDRGPTMRFATRRQLKVTLAARIAVCYLQYARSLGLAVGGCVLNQESQWHAPAAGAQLTQGLLAQLIAPCTPLAFDAPHAHLHSILGHLAHRMPGGSFVLLLSDFAAFDAQLAAPLLQQLAARHTVRAQQILDPVEQRLPATGAYLIDTGDVAQELRIDARDHTQRQRYQELFQQRQWVLQACCKQAGVALRTCSTTDDISTCLEPGHGR